MNRKQLIQFIISIFFIVCVSNTASAVGYKVGLYDAKKVMTESVGKRGKAELKASLDTIIKRIQNEENFKAIYEMNDPKKHYYSEDPIDLTERLVTELSYMTNIEIQTLPRSNKGKTSGFGTGFSVREDGYILTCYHVVAKAYAISAVSSDGEEIPARLMRQSKYNDIALLKIDKNTPYFLNIIESGDVNLGDSVFTIGYPAVTVLGLEPKYSNGTISSLAGIQDEASFMQISVPVQPGNSGGPLVNDDGEVVGIITSKAADIPFLKSTGSLPQNINWAVKAEIAKSLFKKSTIKKAKKSDKSAAIENTRKSVYLIVVYSAK